MRGNDGTTERVLRLCGGGGAEAVFHMLLTAVEIYLFWTPRNTRCHPFLYTNLGPC